MSYFDDQIEAWFDGGAEWYLTEKELKSYDYEKHGMPGDFDPYYFWAETGDDDINQANDMIDGNGDMIEIDDE